MDFYIARSLPSSVATTVVRALLLLGLSGMCHNNN